ncbi:MAG TPA: hypothetical protein PLF31_01115 [Candidatus Paceibacterota bacterium]|nr:hypothetical protein [Candidatus Paceibacterota bacterium]
MKQPRASRAAIKAAMWYGLAGAFTILAFFAIKGAWGMYTTYAEVSKYAKQAEKSFNDMQARKIQLEDNIAAIKTPLGKEIEMRKKYGVGKEGEGVYIFVEQEDEE